MLSHESAKQCYEKIKGSQLIALRRELVLKAIAYAQIRAQWQQYTLDQRRDMDQARSLAHNAFIDACNIMSRNMGKHAEDNSWRAILGDDRKAIGDLACYIHCYVGIEAR